MFLLYEWFKESESISQYFFRFMVVLLCLIILLFSVFGISYIINKTIISSNENYILISMTKLNSITIIILMVSIVIANYLYGSMMKDIKEFRFGWKYERKCRICFIVSLIMIVIGLVYCSNNYYVFGNDKIEKHSIIGTTIYSYKDVKSTDCGYKNIKYDKYFYYKVNLKDGESIDIVNGLVLEPNEKDVVLKVAQTINTNK